MNALQCSKLKHDNIVEVVGILEAPNDDVCNFTSDIDDANDLDDRNHQQQQQQPFSYMVTEWMEGGNLEQALRKWSSTASAVQSLSFVTRVSLALDVARALYVCIVTIGSRRRAAASRVLHCTNVRESAQSVRALTRAADSTS